MELSGLTLMSEWMELTSAVARATVSNPKNEILVRIDARRMPIVKWK
jgi:hypothetical protein